MSELETVRLQCQALRMPTAVEVAADIFRQAIQEEWSYERCLSALLQQELVGRETRRVQRMIKASQLPAGKTLATFDTQRLPLRVRRQLEELSSGRIASKIVLL